MIDHRRICYALRCPSRGVFLAVMAALHHPITAEPLAVETTVEGETYLATAQDVIIDEIGEITVSPGDENTPPVVIDDHHVNMYAVGALAGLLMPDPVANLLALLGDTEFAPGGQHDFDGYVGSSGIKVNLMSVTEANGLTSWTNIITTPARVML